MGDRSTARLLLSLLLAMAALAVALWRFTPGAIGLGCALALLAAFTTPPPP